jgi:hypothetical protein
MPFATAGEQIAEKHRPRGSRRAVKHQLIPP